MTTTDLIPTNGVHITEAEYPNGFYVARYDAEGFTSQPRWFETLERAQMYARGLDTLSFQSAGAVRKR